MGTKNSLGPYRLLAGLGSGGMGDVYLATRDGPGRFKKLVVVKELRPTLALDAAFVDMFLDEARLAARLSHPNVVQTYEISSERGSYFIAMEYLDGQPLHRVFSRFGSRGGLPLAAGLRILCAARRARAQELDAKPRHRRLPCARASRTAPRRSAPDGTAPPDDGFFEPTAAFLGAFRGPDDRWDAGRWIVWK